MSRSASSSANVKSPASKVSSAKDGAAKAAAAPVAAASAAAAKPKPMSLQYFVEKGWQAYTAEASTDGKGDGKQSCEIVLWYRRKGDLKFAPVQGKTGNGAGHAEMDAINTLLAMIPSGTFHDHEYYLDCTAKPCCARCSVVLGWLAVHPNSKATMKSKTCMGGTQWVVSAAVRDLFISKGLGPQFLQFMQVDNGYVNKMLK